MFPTPVYYFILNMHQTWTKEPNEAQFIIFPMFCTLPCPPLSLSPVQDIWKQVGAYQLPASATTTKLTFYLFNTDDVTELTYIIGIWCYIEFIYFIYTATEQDFVIINNWNSLNKTFLLLIMLSWIMIASVELYAVCGHNRPGGYDTFSRALENFKTLFGL